MWTGLEIKVMKKVRLQPKLEMQHFSLGSLYTVESTVLFTHAMTRSDFY